MTREEAITELKFIVGGRYGKENTQQMGGNLSERRH